MQTKTQHSPTRQDTRHVPRSLALLFGFFLYLTGLIFGSYPVSAGTIARCLRHSDCPQGFSCTSRRCFKGIQIVVGGRKTAAYHLAIPKVRWFGAPNPHANQIKRDVWLQINRNFKLLPGTFKLLNHQSFLERPPYTGVDIGTFYFKPWVKIKASGLIKVGVRQKDKTHVTLLFRFYDVDESKMIVRINKTVAINNYRWSVHQFCDRIYKYLTGKAGIFSTMIAYVKRNRKKGKDIWIADFDGKNRRRVVSNGSINVLPRWSPDGRSLIFTSYLTGGASLYKLDLKTRKMTRLFRRRGTYTGASFNPKSGLISFAMTARGSNTASDIYVSKINGSKRKRLTKSWGIDVSPSWAPDGKRLAFVSERFASPQIFSMNADGSSQVRLTFKGNYNQEPRWSPAGNEIMFTARDEFLQYDLFVIRLNKDASGKLKPSYRRLTQNQGTNLEATWSPDGRYILFITTRVGERKLFIMNIDGSKQHLFLRGWGNFETPAWSPLMKSPILPGGSAGRNYYSRVKLFGVKKTYVGSYVADDATVVGTAKAAPTKKPAPIKQKAVVKVGTKTLSHKQPAKRVAAQTITKSTKPTTKKMAKKVAQSTTISARTKPSPKIKPKQAQIKPKKEQPKARKTKPKARKTDKDSQPKQRKEG